MIFFVGLHQPSDAKHFDTAFISVNRTRKRLKPIAAKAWIMDSGAFTEISTYGEYRTTVHEYAEEINRWSQPDSGLIAAVSQDYMCEPFIIEKTGLSIKEHQHRTIQRYDELLPLVPGTYLMPVLQGFAAEDYAAHVTAYGDRLSPGAWVGVGSVCKRNANVGAVVTILATIKRERPDLRLHGFGLKITALMEGAIRDLLHTADSMAWSYAARLAGRSPNDWREAAAFAARIKNMPVQLGWQV